MEKNGYNHTNSSGTYGADLNALNDYATHTDKKIETTVAQSINVGQEHNYGYEVKWEDEEYNPDENAALNKYAINGLNISENLHVLSNTYEDTVYGYWLASPSAGYDYGVVGVSYVGYVSYDPYNTYLFGLRPIVSLKSSVQIEKQEDGTYKIVE